MWFISAHDNHRMNQTDLDGLQGAVRLADWGVIRAQAPMPPASCTAS